MRPSIRIDVVSFVDFFALLVIPRNRPRSLAVWLHNYQLNGFGSRAGRLTGFPGIWRIDSASVRLKSRQNQQILALVLWC